MSEMLKRWIDNDLNFETEMLKDEVRTMLEANTRLLRANEILIAQRDELRRIFEPPQCVIPAGFKWDGKPFSGAARLVPDTTTGAGHVSEPVT